MQPNPEMLARYGAALRQVLVLEAAYPCLAQINELWYFLPAGRPDRLSAEARYIIYAYRAATAEVAALRADLLEQDATLQLAAVEAETAFDWQREQAALPAEWAPPLPEFASLTQAIAVA
jgi:hypothetical protein